MKRTIKLSSLTLLFLLLSACVAGRANAQTRGSLSDFQGEWNWAIYAKDKSELPPAYQSMEIKEVPAYALSLTLKRRGKRLVGQYGVLARYLARIEDGSFSARVEGGAARVRLQSNFGGSATVELRRRGDKLYWRASNSVGENYFPKEVALRRLRKGEKPPYVAALAPAKSSSQPNEGDAVVRARRRRS